VSDTYYRQQAERRRAGLLVAGIALAAVGLLAVGGHLLYYDACTGSYARSPRDVVSAYVAALRQGDLSQTQECWQHLTYYDLEAGCSEICVSRFAGASFDVTSLEVSEPQTIGRRATVHVTVEIACSNGSSHDGEVILDGIATAPPWRHWAIVRSTIGGTLAEAWCK